MHWIKKSKWKDILGTHQYVEIKKKKKKKKTKITTWWKKKKSKEKLENTEDEDKTLQKLRSG